MTSKDDESDVPREYRLQHPVTYSTEVQAEIAQGLAAWKVQEKTFNRHCEICRAMGGIREKANELGGRNTFHALLRQAGFPIKLNAEDTKGVIYKTEVTVYLRMYDNYNSVRVWYDGLTAHEQYKWQSPPSADRHCPAMIEAREKARGKPKPGEIGHNRAPIKLSVAEQNAALRDEVARLRKLGSDGFTVSALDSVDTIVGHIDGALRPDKFRKVGETIVALCNKRKKMIKEEAEENGTAATVRAKTRH